MEYWDDEETKIESEYHNGSENGWQKKYFFSGQIEEEYYWVDAHCAKHFKKWNEAGELTYHGIYADDGRFIEQIV